MACGPPFNARMSACCGLAAGRGSQSLADVGAALGDGLDKTLFTEQCDGAAGSAAGYFPHFDDLGLGWDARALAVLARFDA